MSRSGTSCDDSVDKYTNWVFPKKSTKQSDLVLNMLSKIQCLTPDGAGGQTRTHLALSMHTMRGARGNYLASAIRQKWAEGCDFRVSYGLIGFKTKQILGASTVEAGFRCAPRVWTMTPRTTSTSTATATTTSS